MVYLVATQDKKFLKIGFTKNSKVSSRFKTLQAGTPNTLELINTRKGTMKDEFYLHMLCKEYNYRNEWYYYHDEVIRIFNTTDLSEGTKEDRAIEIKSEKDKNRRLKFFKEDGTKRYDNTLYIKELLSEMVIKGYANMWVYHTFIKNTPYIYRSDLEFMATKLGYAKGWVSYKMAELAGRVINDVHSKRELLNKPE